MPAMTIQKLIEEAHKAERTASHMDGKWARYYEAADIFRSKGWGWTKIWNKMVEIGLVKHSVQDRQRFRSTMSNRESRRKGARLSTHVAV